jgi:hypothetical protein
MELGSIATIFGGMIGCGALAFIAYKSSTFFANRSQKREASHKTEQSSILEKIGALTKKEEPILKQIQQSEIISEKTKEEIKKVQQDANVKIQEILKKEDFSELSKKEDQLW